MAKKDNKTTIGFKKSLVMGASHGDSPLGITAVYFAMIFLHLYICHQIFSFLVIFSRWDSTRYNRRPQNYSSKFGDLNKRLYLCNRKM